MTEVRVRRLSEDIKRLLREQATRKGSSLEAYLRTVLEEIALRPRQEIAARLEAFREDVRREHGILSDSAVLIRQDRDARG